MVDIGTNSMRLLITDGAEDVGRWVQVTGLGRGVDATGVLSEDALERTIDVLERFGAIMEEEGVRRRAAMATSATRDASNRDELMDRAGAALGVRPEVIEGDREGELAYAGATADLDGGPFLVSDIGGGSTEFVTTDESVSIDIGSVRLTDRILTDRPPPAEQMRRAVEHVSELFSGVSRSGDLIGVAGTWTNIAGMVLRLPSYDPARIHLQELTREAVAEVTARLAGMTVEETEAIPSLDPGRAPVILAGAVVANGVMDAVGAGSVLVSERDTLDGLARELLGLT